jgi:hypothetical protein
MPERVLLGTPYTAIETGPHALCIRHQHGMVSWEVQATSDKEPGHYGFGLNAGQVVHAVTLDGNGEPVGVDGAWADGAGSVWALDLRNHDEADALADWQAVRGHAGHSALVAVLDLHKPVTECGDMVCEQCEGWSGACAHWPCPTYEAIKTAGDD